MAIQQVRVQIDNTWHTLTYNGITGKYEKTISAPAITSFNLPGGYYPVTAEATDDHGNTATDTNSRLIVKEIVAPVIQITNPTAGAQLMSNTPTFSWTLRDEANGSGINIDSLVFKIDGTIITNANITKTAVTNGYDCSYTPLAGLSDGSHNASVDVSDNDVNVATAKTVTFSIDTVPPELTVSSPVDNLKTNQAQQVVSGITNDSSGSAVTVKITVNGVEQGSVTVAGDGSFNKTVTCAIGNNTIIIRSTDAVGRYTEVTRSVSLNMVAPVISNVAITPNPANTDDSILISCTVTDS